MATSLPLLGALPAGPARSGPAVAQKGFRPFFLIAGAFAVAILPLWMLTLLGLAGPGAYFDAMSWHAHEMVFGFAVAVIAGFLLTAVGNWTKRETLVGPGLLALAALFVAGRVAVFVPQWLPKAAVAAIDLAFLPALAIVLARPLVLSKNWRNLIMLVVLAGLFLANLGMHLDALGVISGVRRRASLAAVDLVVLVIFVMAARVFPMFTRNATGASSIRSSPRLDLLAAVSMAALTLADAVAASAPAGALLAAVTCVLVVARSAHWGARHSLRHPLVWILHVGHAWIAIGLALRALAAVTPLVPAAVATHALTVGAIGGLTLGMMARVSLGHTGRMLAAGSPVALSFVLVTLAAVARVFLPLTGLVSYRAAVFAAGSLWTAAFGMFLVVYVPILISPRADGKPG